MIWKIFTENTIQSNNIEEYNPNKEHKILIVCGDVIADLLSNKITSTKSNRIIYYISLVFTTQSYFAVPKNIRLNSTHYFNLKISNKLELQQIIHQILTLNNLYKFMNLYKNLQQIHILFQ